MVAALKPKDLLDHKGAYKRYLHGPSIKCTSYGKKQGTAGKSVATVTHPRYRHRPLLY